MIETGVKGHSAPVKSNHTIECYILLTSIFPCIPKILLLLYACYNELTLLMIYLSGMEPSCCCGFHGPAAVCSWGLLHGCCKVCFGKRLLYCVCMQPVHEMPVVIRIIAQLSYYNNLLINDYMLLF